MYTLTTISSYLQALLLLALGTILLLMANLILKKRIHQKEEIASEMKFSSSLTLLRFAQRIALPLAFLGLISLSMKLADFSDRLQYIVQTVFTIFMTIIIVRSLNKAVELAFFKYFEKEWANHDQEKHLKPLLSLMKFLFWLIGILFLLANLGFDVSTAVAGLGVGGIAVAIAAQGILGDLFSYFVIFFDKPFELGDFIIFGDKMGIVERIGIKSIRIRVLSGELLVIANSDLTAARIHNYKQMKRRRVVFSIGVTYETHPDKVEAIPQIIRTIIEHVEAIEGVTCDRSHFQAFGPYSLNFETVYYIPSPDYTIYMNVQQEIYQKLYRAFHEQDIEFAYPTQKLFTQAIQNTEDASVLER